MYPATVTKFLFLK